MTLPDDGPGIGDDSRGARNFDSHAADAQRADGSPHVNSVVAGINSACERSSDRERSAGIDRSPGATDDGACAWAGGLNCRTWLSCDFRSIADENAIGRLGVRCDSSGMNYDRILACVDAMTQDIDGRDEAVILYRRSVAGEYAGRADPCSNKLTLVQDAAIASN